MRPKVRPATWRKTQSDSEGTSPSRKEHESTLPTTRERDCGHGTDQTSGPPLSGGCGCRSARLMMRA